jgi:uncharacterized protein (TIGR02722 family)
MMKIFLLLIMLGLLSSCGGFQAKRVGAEESDKQALKVTDNWVAQDTTNAINEVIKQMKNHPGFKRYMASYRGGQPKVFVAEVQNLTSEAYFPINDINDELLNELSMSGDFVLIDNQAREAILKEIVYQNDGMVDPATAKSVGKQTGADVMIFGNVFMQPESRDGKTVKQYAVNIRLTNIENGTEILRTRTRVFKSSSKSAFGF